MQGCAEDVFAAECTMCVSGGNVGSAEEEVINLLMGPA